ncbi:hypothetical protein CCH79_00020776, partial [Gambusia affinis]
SGACHCVPNVSIGTRTSSASLRVKPLHYISWMMGHEGTGSILSLLRKRCWALALYGGNSESGFDQNSTYSIFSISITLTDLGYQNFLQVVHLVFQYLKMLQNLGPQQRIYEEIQKIEDNEFRFQEQTDPIEFVENICENMQLFPKPDLLTADQLMFHYDPEVIRTALSLLTPLRANLLLLAPENEGSCPLQEKWFGTSYSCDGTARLCPEQVFMVSVSSDIPEEWERRWESDFELNADLHLPAENRFIATDFNLKKSDCPDTEFPVQILALEQGALWYKKDNKFKIPKAYIRFHLISPIIQESPDNPPVTDSSSSLSLVLFDLFINILAHNLAEPAYEAEVAQLEYNLMAGEHGMVIRLKGFNHKLPLLLKLIVDQLADFSAEPSVFDMFVKQLKKTYFNILIKHDKLGRDVRLLILEHHRWSVVQKYQVLTEGLQVQQLMAFAAALKEELYAEGLVQGNFTSAESIEFLQYFTEKLRFRPPPAEVPVQFQVVDLPRRHHLCRVKSLNREDANSEVTVYYQSGLKTLKEHALMELMVMLMEEPCFDFLRTKEMLGYQVYPTFRNTSGVLGFSVTVETQATKFSSELVEQKIEDFLVSFGRRLASLSRESFAAQVTALIKLKECEDAHLGEEVDRNWYEVVTQQYLFDRLGREVSRNHQGSRWVEVLKGFSREQLVSWFLDHRGNCSRKLSVHTPGSEVCWGGRFCGTRTRTRVEPEVMSSPCMFHQVVGFGVEENDPPHQNRAGSAPSSYGPVSELTFLPAAAPTLRNATLITDIRAFTSSLPLHPYYKILS